MQELDKRLEDNLSAEERKERDEQMVEQKEAEDKWEELKAPERQPEFIDWIWERFVKPKGTEAKPNRPITDKEKSKDFPFARAIVAKVSSKIHPDSYVNEKFKRQKYEKIASLVNNVVNRLKGL